MPSSPRPMVVKPPRLPAATERLYREALGPVDKPDPAPQAADQDEANVAAGGFVISRSDPALLSEMAHTMLYASS